MLDVVTKGSPTIMGPDSFTDFGQYAGVNMVKSFLVWSLARQSPAKLFCSCKNALFFSALWHPKNGRSFPTRMFWRQKASGILLWRCAVWSMRLEKNWSLHNTNGLIQALTGWVSYKTLSCLHSPTIIHQHVLKLFIHLVHQHSLHFFSYHSGSTSSLLV